MLASLGPAKHAASSRVFLASGRADSPLQQALSRAVRAGRPAAVLMAALSRMQAPGARPHHHRVCRAVIDLAVRAHSGQVFTCPNGDLVLLAAPEVAEEAMATLSVMLRAEARGALPLLQRWTVPGDEDAVQAALAPLTGPLPTMTEEPPAPIGAIAAVGALLASAPGGELIRRQPGVRIAGGVITQLYQEMSFSLAALEARIGLRLPAGTDPYLFRHLARELDGQMLNALARDKLVVGTSVHLNLTLPSLLTDGWSRLLPAAARSGITLGIELQFMEVVADLPRFAAARAKLRAAGCPVILSGLDHGALLLAAPETLGPDWLKLDWSPCLPALPSADRLALAAAIERIGSDRLILQRAETEAALAWGLAAGIRCFQGRYVDSMLAAERLKICPHAGGCSLRHCIDRGAATDAAGQAGCLNPALLDAPSSPAMALVPK